MKKYILVAFILLLAGCDTFHGPWIRNDFQVPIKLTTELRNGTVQSNNMPPCVVFGLDFIESKPYGQITDLKLYKDGEIIHQLDATEIKEMQQKQYKNKNAASVWSINARGIELVYDQSVEECQSRIFSDP